MIIDNGTVVENDAMIIQKDLTILSTLVTDADNLSVSNPIQNSGELYFTGGENNNDIEGTGTLLITGDVVNSTGTKVSQEGIWIDVPRKLTAYSRNMRLTSKNITRTESTAMILR